MCPHCGKEAPIVYRGQLAYCFACNHPRAPLVAAGVNVTGKPSKLGGKVAAVLGWVVLAVMSALALLLGGLFHALLGAAAAWIVGGVVAVIGIAAALFLILGGRFLQRSGERAQFAARRDAVFALARSQEGIVRAGVAGAALGISSVEADALLTNLSREPESGVTLEVDGDGKLYYRFTAIAPEAPWPPLGGGEPAALDQPRVRVKTEVGFPGAEALEEAADDQEAQAKRARAGG